jgi:PQQ-dependent dehydrogenase (s-GDH family)
MRKVTKTLLLLYALVFANYFGHAQDESFSKRVVNGSYTFNSVWELTYGPHDSLWVTENKAYLVSRVNIANGSKTVLLDLLGTSGDKTINFAQTSSASNKKTGLPKRVVPAIWPQGGLMGMALHPALYSTDPAVRNAKPWVYISYVYYYFNDGTCSSNTPCYFYTKIVRYNYSGSSLSNPVTILDSIPGSNDHNSGRLKIGPDSKLYYTVGDMGAGQYNNTSRQNNAQNLNIMEGKVLRLNTEPDGDAGKDAWIPNDNPFYDGAPFSPKDYVYTFGHRNAQGLDWAAINGNDLLFSSEHGDKSDDEVNIIKGGNSYGWNRVAGYCDGNYDGLTLGGYSPVNEEAYCSSTPNSVTPLYTMFTATPAEISQFTSDIFTYKTVAPSSIEIYKSTAIPGWQNSALISTLKGGRVYRIKLNDSTGSSVVNLSTGVDTAAYFAGEGRFRDVAISPNGLKIYVACDISGATSGPTGGFNNKITSSTPPNAGKILEFTYSGPVSPSTIREYVTMTEQLVDFRMYPNPTSGNTSFEIGFNEPRSMVIEVYNIVGMRVKTMRTSKNKFDIDLKQFPAGVYSVRISDIKGKLISSQKLIKQ